MLYRKVGRSPSRESWHRDEAINAEENDQIFGGWINLDTEDQYFSCAPGTHTGVKGHSGFAPISKEEAKKYNKKEVKKSVTIPPCLLYTSPSPRDRQKSRMPSSA